MTSMIRTLALGLRRALRTAVTTLLAASVMSASADTVDGLFTSAQLLRFKMNTSETLAFLGSEPCFFVSTVQAKGKSTQLGGMFSASSTECLNPHGAFDPNNGNTFSFATQAPGMVLTTGAGHKVYTSYSGTLNKLGGLSGNFVILGGTGPYLGATGGGLLLGYVQMSPAGTATGTIEGFGTLQLANKP
jgi:hypothetical protein